MEASLGCYTHGTSTNSTPSTCATSDAFWTSPAWQDKVSNTEVLERANLPSMYSLLKQRRLRWLGQVCKMEEGRIPKDILYGELGEGKRPAGRPQLRFKDICKRDLKSMNIDTNSWETLAKDRSVWEERWKMALILLRKHSHLTQISINLLVFYHECRSLIGYATRYLFCDR